MELTDVQKAAVIGWAKEGLGLSEIQKRLLSEFELKLTYMDVRFLVLDLECDIKDKKTAPEPKKAATEGVSSDQGDDDPDGDGVGGAAGGVAVDLDRVVKAGAVISGTVVFSDGVHASWAVDNLGRMVLDPGGDAEYRPTPEDVRAFQIELKRLVTQRGY